MSKKSNNNNKSSAKNKITIEPLIKRNTTTLKDKDVNIKGTDDFKRRPTDTKTVAKTKKTKEDIAKEKKDKVRKTTMKTQKMSLDVLLKLEILDAFLRNAEGLDSIKNISINDKIDILIESYTKLKLTSRQLEGFKTIYESYTN